jgi:hypothetical protein
VLCVLLDSLYCMSGCVIVSFCNHGFTPIKQTTLNSQPQLMSSACEKSAKLRRRPPRRVALSIAVTPSISLTTRWQAFCENYVFLSTGTRFGWQAACAVRLNPFPVSRQADRATSSAPVSRLQFATTGFAEVAQWIHLLDQCR